MYNIFVFIVNTIYTNIYIYIYNLKGHIWCDIQRLAKTFWTFHGYCPAKVFIENMWQHALLLRYNNRYWDWDIIIIKISTHYSKKPFLVLILLVLCVCCMLKSDTVSGADFSGCSCIYAKKRMRLFRRNHIESMFPHLTQIRQKILIRFGWGNTAAALTFRNI